jgi:regulator of protease activity HflC (stomatin/prohibitin superfamily)
MLSRTRWWPELQSRWWHLRRYLRQHTVTVAVLLLILLFLIIYFAESMFITIPAGRVGVLWERFGGGTVLNRTLGEGFHVIMPWNKIYIYDIRVQLRDQTLDVLSVDGLNLKIDVAYRFELVKENIPLLHQFVGPDYVETIVSPDIAARARDVFSANTPEEIFSDRRKEIQAEIIRSVNAHLAEAFNPEPNKHITFVRVEDVLTRSITLPPSVVAAINSKNEQQQLNQEYDYRILREGKEAERKRIEAGGIKQFQDIISQGITDSYLRWRGIEATLELAKSPNAKIVIIGGGKSGLPIILGDSGSGREGPTSVAQASPLEVPPLSPLDALEKQLRAAAPPPPTPRPVPTESGRGTSQRLMPRPPGAPPAGLAPSP